MTTIIICTHNRSELLEECLNSLLQQDINLELLNVLVVDNRSTDQTRQVVESFQGDQMKVSYVYEEEVGLSAARNRGYEESKTEWVTYLDDDSVAHPDLARRINEAIAEDKFEIIGGIYHQWFRDAKPNWFPKEEGTNKYNFSGPGLLPDNEFVSGGIMTIYKEVFRAIGGFKSSLGMKGNQIYYGEEIEFQRRARKEGFKIGMIPNIEIDHLVRKEKLEVRWWLTSYYQKGMSAIEVFEKGKSNRIMLVFKGLAYLVVMVPFYFFKWIVFPGFKFGNFIIKSFGPLYYLAGQFESHKQLRKST